ncbi:MAG: hypothetical protein C3F13_07165 [Anaerolineales bacterium]|nr:MAG: hypothetical protein C3F13_07165 [Anaerolineales bacterium]
MLAHGALLRKNFFTVEQLLAVVADFRQAGLSEQEVALMTFAQKVIQHPGEITEVDINALRAYDLSDEQVLDLVVVITARSFFSKTLDALKIQPDDVYKDLEPELIQALSIGRPFP